MYLPLAGVRVVAVEQAVAMPFCSFVLAELGADVIRVEPLSGDVIRGWDEVVRGLASGFVWLNTGKRDIAVDLKCDSGQQIVRRLVRTADVFVENFAPGVADRLGIGSAALTGADPALIYCSLSGYGQDGPWRTGKAYDLLIQGESGLLMTNGTEELPAKIGVPIADLVAGATACISIVAALYERNRTNGGHVLDVAMLDAVALWLGYFAHRSWHNGEEPPRTGTRHQYLSPYGPYRAADGRLVNLVVASDTDWRRFCVGVADRPEWLDDPNMRTLQARTQNRSTVETAVEALIATEPAEVWLRRLRAAGLAAGAVRTIGEALAHPQLKARKVFVPADSPVGTIPVTRFATADVDKPRVLPDFAEHTEQVLLEAGFTRTEIADYVTSGVVFCGRDAGSGQANAPPVREMRESG